MRLEAGNTVLFLGDSITDADRDRSRNGEGDLGLGNGFVRAIASLMTVCHPDRPVRIVNQGIAGNTMRDLAGRWDEAIATWKPQWLSVMIGVNDVWRQFDRPLAREHHVLPREFEQTLNALLGRTRPTLDGLVLMTPFFVDTNLLEPMRQLTERYAGIVAACARRHDALLVDTQTMIDGLMHHHQGFRLSGDRVHPNAAGHMALARAWLQAVDFTW